MTKDEKIEMLSNKVISLIQNYFKTQKEIRKTLKELTKLDDSYQGMYDHLIEKENEMKKEMKKEN